MNAAAEAALASVFLVFCRVGGCMMLAPGFSSERVPVRVRLAIALAVSIAAAPLVGVSIEASQPLRFIGAIATELAFGLFIGLLGRFFLLALETLLTAAALSIGLGNAMTGGIDADGHVSPLASLGTLAASMAVFATEAHLDLIRGLVVSYAVMPAGAAFEAGVGLTQVVDMCTRTFLLSLRLASPFLVYGVVANLAAGLANRLAPQAQIYFVATPFILAGGLVLGYLSLKGGFAAYFAEFADWARRG